MIGNVSSVWLVWRVGRDARGRYRASTCARRRVVFSVIIDHRPPCARRRRAGALRREA